jgi:hypothetical protein
MNELKLDKAAEEAALKEAFKAYFNNPMNVEGAELINKAIQTMAEGAFLEGAKYATERITKMFHDTLKIGIPFPKL